MRLLIVSHTPHYRRDGRIVGWGPTVRELDYLAEMFAEIVHVAPVYDEPPPDSALSYASVGIGTAPKRCSSPRCCGSRYIGICHSHTNAPPCAPAFSSAVGGRCGCSGERHLRSGEDQFVAIHRSCRSQLRRQIFRAEEQRGNGRVGTGDRRGVQDAFGGLEQRKQRVRRRRRSALSDGTHVLGRARFGEHDAIDAVQTSHERQIVGEPRGGGCINANQRERGPR